MDTANINPQKRKEEITKIRKKIQRLKEINPPKQPVKKKTKVIVSAKAIRFAKREALRKVCFEERRRQKFKRRLYDDIKKLPWWILSALFHLLLLSVFTHIILDFIDNRPPHIMKVGWYVEAPLEVESEIKAEPNKEEQDSSEKIEEEEDIEEVSETEDPKEKEIKAPIAVPENASVSEQETKASMYSGRSVAGKGDALKRYGGSAGTEAAVRNGLEWLARHQSSDGSWSGREYVKECKKRCDTNVIYYDYPSGFTGLVLLCYLGAGETHLAGDFQKNIAKGIDFLLKNQRHDGYFGPGYVSIYSQAIATLAIVEAYGITKQPKLKKAGEKGINFLVRSQQRGGGWDYYSYATGRNDLSITGWVVMALKSARYANVPVPPNTWKEARSFVNRMYDSGGGYFYADQGPPYNFKERKGAAMMGVGALCNLFFGTKSDSKKILATAMKLKRYQPDWKKLVSTEPKPMQKPGTSIIFYNKDIYNYSVYAWYYGTLVMFQVGGEYWDSWNEKMKKAIVPNQRRRGCQRGSWDPVERWLSPYGGRLYATTLNILNLEVYYRYLPIYKAEGDVLIISDDDVVRAAEEMLQHGDQRRKSEALEQLTTIEDKAARKRAFEHACTMLKDKSLTIRWKAVKTLRKMKNEKALSHLFQAFSVKKNKMLKRYIIETVAEFEDPTIFTFLVEVLAGENQKLKEKAYQSLKKWTNEDLGTSPKAWKNWWEIQQKKRNK